METETLEKVRSDPDLFQEMMFEVTDKIFLVSLYLAEEEEWEFYMNVFMGVDLVQRFWRYVEENHPRYEDDN